MMKNQGQNGVQKQAVSKKVRESALTGQTQGIPTDSQSVGLDFGGRIDDIKGAWKLNNTSQGLPTESFTVRDCRGVSAAGLV